MMMFRVGVEMEADSLKKYVESSNERPLSQVAAECKMLTQKQYPLS